MVARRKTRTTFTADTKAAAVADLNTLSLGEVADKYGASVHTVRLWAKLARQSGQDVRVTSAGAEKKKTAPAAAGISLTLPRQVAEQLMVQLVKELHGG